MKKFNENSTSLIFFIYPNPIGNVKNQIDFFKQFSILLILLFSSFFISAQDTVKVKNWKLKGYVSAMPSVMTQDFKNDFTGDYLLHNRLNFSWSPMQFFSTEIDVRNRIIAGDRIRKIPGYKEQYNAEAGAVDLSENLISSKSAIFNTSVDRAFLKFSKGKFDIAVGRQRINWGQTFVWNPNDIFNAYSFFDFDYSEKQGSDALRIQFYPSAVSVIESAIKLDSAGKITGGALWKFNKRNYDFQLIGGMINEQDYVAGLGFSGNIKSISLRGEASFFHPKNNFEDTSGIVTACIAADYTFSNQAFMQIEFLYNYIPQKNQNFNLLQFAGLALSAKTLSFTEYNFFAQFSYPVTPLFKASIAAIYYPELNGFYAGPSVEYSICENLDASLILQAISGEFTVSPNNKKQRLYLSLAFIRLKWSF